MGLSKRDRAIREHVKTAVNCICGDCEKNREKKGLPLLAPDPTKLWDTSRPEPEEVAPPR